METPYYENYVSLMMAVVKDAADDYCLIKSGIDPYKGNEKQLLKFFKSEFFVHFGLDMEALVERLNAKAELMRRPLYDVVRQGQNWAVVEYGTNNVVSAADYTQKSTALNAAAKLQGLPFVDFMATYRFAKQKEKR